MMASRGLEAVRVRFGPDAHVPDGTHTEDTVIDGERSAVGGFGVTRA